MCKWLIEHFSPIPSLLSCRTRPKTIGVTKEDLHFACIVFVGFLGELIPSLSGCRARTRTLSALLLRNISSAEFYEILSKNNLHWHPTAR